ncbi:MAG: helix-hairpin-helix domain-containing protein [Desulfuromonadales bacterium]|nr:MAG: helix-hairpin-helix domain-containing protein [Desulfuromonadales bacterium]
MKASMQELQKIKGIGEVLAKRLIEEGLDSNAKIAEAGEEAIRKIRGMNPRAVSSIIAQASGLAEEGAKDRTRRVEGLKAVAATLKDQMEGIARGVRDRFADEIQGKGGRKVEKEILKMMASLERVEGKLGTRIKRAGKGLAKAEKHLAGIADQGLKELEKGLRKARKSLKRVVAK